MRVAIAAGACLLSLAGCATADHSALNNALAEARSCEGAIAERHPDLTARLAWRGGPPSLPQLADGGMPTEAEVQDLYRLQPLANGCLTQLQRRLAAARDPLMSALAGSIQAGRDRVFLALVQRASTWGQANQQLATMRDRHQRETAAILANRESKASSQNARIGENIMMGLAAGVAGAAAGAATAAAMQPAPAPPPPAPVVVVQPAAQPQAPTPAVPLPRNCLTTGPYQNRVTTCF